MRIGGIAVALIMLVASAASAQSPDVERARHEFDRGVSAYDAGDYANALVSFQAAYELTQHPNLLVNISLCQEHLGRVDEAIDGLTRYLASDASASNRQAALERLEALRAAHREPTPAETTHVETTHVETAPELQPVASDPGPMIAGASLLGGGALAVIAGAIAVAVAVGDVSQVERPAPGTPWNDVAPAYGQSEGLSVAGFVLLGVGAAAATAGVIVLTLPQGGGGTTAALHVVPGGLRFEGSF